MPALCCGVFDFSVDSWSRSLGQIVDGDPLLCFFVASGILSIGAVVVYTYVGIRTA